MRQALYGPDGFYSRGEAPSRHFRTSAHASPRYAEALLGLLDMADAALGRPDRLDVVDVGAGRGELLRQILALADHDTALAARIRAHAVEVAPRPEDLDERIRWRRQFPAGAAGLVVATEWLDNIPVDVAELTADGPRLVLVEPSTGAERSGPPARPRDRAWLRRWWPLCAVGSRAEIGRPRCACWASVTRRLARGIAVAADYGHLLADRPEGATLSGYRDGRAAAAIPDGTRDITAHVAMDACAAAGERAGASATVLTSQRAALLALGLRGARPPLRLAAEDPSRYAAELRRASEDAELTDPGGMGGFRWLVQSVGIGLPAPLATLRGEAHQQGAAAGHGPVARATCRGPAGLGGER